MTKWGEANFSSLFNSDVLNTTSIKPAGGLPPALGAMRRNCSASILKSVERYVSISSGHIPPDGGTRPDETFKLSIISQDPTDPLNQR